MIRQRQFLVASYCASKVALAIILFWVAIGCKPIADPIQPNILLILTDDQGYGDVGFHGNQNIDTPHLNQLASESISFERFYVSPVCAPTRASILTGRYHLATGTRWVTHREEVMRSEEVTLAELFAAVGYSTGLFGKWHNGKQYPHNPNGQGFQEFFGFTDGHINNYFDTDLMHNKIAVKTEGYLPDVLTDKVIDFMKIDQPFFTMLSFNTPHSPFQVPDEYFDKYKAQGLDDKTACIYGMVENIDDNVGRALNALKDLGKERNTIVIFLSDNGPNGVRYNANLKGIKSHVDEGGVRSPFLIKYPKANWPIKIIENSTAAHLDILPTLAELASINTDRLELHGRSLVPWIEGEELNDKFFFTHQVIRKFDTIPGAVRKNDWLLTLMPNDTSFYDLKNDPFQKIDIKDQHPTKVIEFQKAYVEWFSEMIALNNGKVKIQIGHPAIPIVEFPAQEVDTYQNTSFQGKEGWANDYFIEWSDSTQVSWYYESVGIANYEIYAQLSSSSVGKMIVKIDDQELIRKIDSPLVKNRIQSPDRVPRGEVYGYEWPLVYVGDFQGSLNQNTISITTSGMDGVELKSIQLKIKEEKI